MAALATVFTPYSVFLFHVAGVLLGLMLVARLAHAAGTVPLGPAYVVAAFLTLVLVSQIWDGAARVDAARTSLNAPLGTDEFDRCFVDGSHGDQLPFVLWLNQNVPVGAAIRVQDVAADYGCFQLTLRGRRFVESAAAADWLVWFGGVSPRLVRRAVAEKALPASRHTVFIFSSRQVAVRRH
jgi:hypothetical protein